MGSELELARSLVRLEEEGKDGHLWVVSAEEGERLPGNCWGPPEGLAGCVGFGASNLVSLNFSLSCSPDSDPTPSSAS